MLKFFAHFFMFNFICKIFAWILFTFLPFPSQCGEQLYEKRHYEKGHWACITMHEDTYEQSICYGFMKIMRYICQQNSLGESKSNTASDLERIFHYLL